MRARSLTRRWSRAVFLGFGIIVIAYGAGGKGPLCKIIALSAGVCVSTERSISSSPHAFIREAAGHNIHRMLIFDVVNRKSLDDRDVKGSNIRNAWIDHGIIGSIVQMAAKIVRIQGVGYFPLRKLTPLLRAGAMGIE